MPPAIPAAETVPLTFDQYLAIFPSAKPNTFEDFEAFVTACARWEINSALRLAAFCAEISHESAGRTIFVENLNYTAGGLLSIAGWKVKFPARSIAEDYAKRGPQAIANRAYAGVNGNGDEASGDGWKYRGRGDIQLTGLANYRAAAQGTGLDLLEKPELAADPQVSPTIAGWFWHSIGANAMADAGNLSQITKRVNGSMTGFVHRAELYAKYKDILMPQSEAVAS